MPAFVTKYAKFIVALPGVISVLIAVFAGETQVEKILSGALTVASAIATLLVPNSTPTVGAHEAVTPDAGLTEIGVIVIAVVLSIAVFLLAHAAWPATF